MPLPYFFPTAQNLNPLALATGSPTTSTNSASSAIGITAPSIAQVNSSQPYALHSFVLGLARRHARRHPEPAHRLEHLGHRRDLEHRDRLGVRLHAADVRRRAVLPGPQTLDARAPLRATAKRPARFRSTSSTRSPTSSCAGTPTRSTEPTSSSFRPSCAFRSPPTVRSRSCSSVTTARPASPAGSRSTATTRPPTSTRISWHADAGIGVRFDVPQLGLRTLRLDFAKGSLGTHISFGIGQAF